MDAILDFEGYNVLIDDGCIYFDDQSADHGINPLMFSFGESSRLYQKGSIFDPDYSNSKGKTNG